MGTPRCQAPVVRSLTRRGRHSGRWATCGATRLSFAPICPVRRSERGPGPVCPPRRVLRNRRKPRLKKRVALRVNVYEVLQRRSRGASLSDIERVYRTRRAAYLRVAAAITRDRDAASDVVQDAFARAVRKRRSFRGDASVETWLWRIVVNTARNYVRDRPHVEPFGDLATTEPELSEFADTVAALPERQRLVVFLRYYADLDYAAIADALAISQGTVGATLNAARATLRGALEEVRT